ncbi:MAG: AraC family transcriptional regulator [Acidimicrobiales bacterium]
MDVVASLLEGPRARNAFIIRTQMASPWALRIEDQAALTVVVILDGECRLEHDSLDEPLRLDTGDLVVVRGPHPYLIGDAQGSHPRIRILPGNRPVLLNGDEIGQSMNLGVRTWGAPADDGETTKLLTGIYADVGEASRRLLDAIGAVVVRPGATHTSAYVGLLASESLSDAPGQSAVLDRLLDLVLIDTVRDHFARNPELAPGWYSALDDALVGSALRAIHTDPAAPWSVTGLAANLGLSRPAFSRRFSQAVGEPPMAYVKRWRLSLAADHLADPDLTIGRIASLVGYQSPFTFSAAFKAHFGMSPSDYRADIAT